jgi:hypothetical protein
MSNDDDKKKKTIGDTPQNPVLAGIVLILGLIFATMTFCGDTWIILFGG